MDKLLEKIKYYQSEFPEKELEKIVKNKEEYIPDLLNIMEDLRDNHKKYLQDNYFIHLYASYLLAQFRVEEFFDILLDIMKLPYEDLDILFGTVITEDMGRMLASTYSGDIDKIFKLIEDDLLDYYIRSTGFAALQVLLINGVIEEKFLVEYLREGLKREMKRRDSDMITEVICNLTDLHVDEAMEDIKVAHKKGMLNEGMMGLEYIEREFEKDKEVIMEYLRNNKHRQFIGDIKDEMAWWACFNGE